MLSFIRNLTHSNLNNIISLIKNIFSITYFRYYLLLILWVMACNIFADEGILEIKSTDAFWQEEVYYLNASIDIALSKDSPPVEALHNGVPLTFVIEIHIFSKNWIGLSKKLAALNQRYRLLYHVLAQQYVLINLNTQQSQSFSDISSALNELGDIRSLPLIDEDLLEKNKSHHGKMRMYLDVSELPFPLKAYGYISDIWALRSDWSEWDL